MEQNTPKAIDFSDLEDAAFWEGEYEFKSDVQDALKSEGLTGAALAFSRKTGQSTTAMREKVTCRDCGGSGKFVGYTGRVLGPCYKCDGKGYQMRAAGYTARKQKEAAQKAEAQKADEAARAEWAKEHTDVIVAIIAGKSAFLQSLADQYSKRGRLSEAQVNAVRSGAQRKAEAEAARGVEVSSEGADRLSQVFQNATSAGLKRPALRVGELVFKPAKASSANAGAIYVTAGAGFDAPYLGKVVGSKFIPSRDCEAGDVSLVERVMADPLAEAVAHGRETGECSCCGRALENEESVRLGIGPVCREKWGM